MPYGPKETFIIPEIIEIQRCGHHVIIIPVRPDKELFHQDAVIFRNETYRADLISSKIIFTFLAEFLHRPVAALKTLATVVLRSRSLKIALKNISVVPKAFYTAHILRREKIDHIHAHWASTPSTVAYIAASLTGIPWSFTAHRWDIAENNILRTKVVSAAFVRAIDENGKKRIVEIVKEKVLDDKIHVLHMGVGTQNHGNSDKQSSDPFTILCPANMVHIKGHVYLLRACRLLRQKGAKIKCLLAGDGTLKDELKALAGELDLNDQTKFLGRLPHEQLLEMYKKDIIDVVILPSIETEAGEAEGIPVALIEAMSFGIPVISTHTGGIPELLGEGAGIMVKDKDSQELANAMETLYNDVSLRRMLGAQGRERVKKEFNLEAVVGEMLKHFSSSKRT